MMAIIFIECLLSWFVNKSGNILAKYQTMDNINIYDENEAVYDKWFDQHSDWFRSEVAALKKALPEKGRGIGEWEAGVLR